ncbi:MAG: glycosyltransferase family 2 protein [Akkermansia sp.]|nr:glycosyltransferase family 2 protein [Akkermansia sp.]
MISKYFELWRYAYALRKRLDMQKAQPSRPAAWRKALLKQQKGHAQYTVVSACYNVAAYLPDYFDSLIGQRLDFRNNIRIICVDDGSTDDTAEIIRRYAEQYPDNITYIRKENGGQAGARNLGLRHVRTPWVCFVDPDDFLDYNCFYETDRRLAQHPDAAVLSMNVVFYPESSRRFIPGHPLSYKYRGSCRAVPINRMGNDIQLSLASAFFRTDIIREHGLESDERIKPNFEDGHLITKYLLFAQDKDILFLRDAKYYYRKRSAGTSTLDGKYRHKELFRDLIRYGYRDMLHLYEEAGITHDYAKRVFLYDIMFTLRDCLLHPEITDILSQEEKATFIALLHDCFAFFSADDIECININGFNWFWKLAAMRCFLGRETELNIAVPVRYDTARKEVWLRLFCGTSAPHISASIGEQEVPVTEDSKRLYHLADALLAEEHILRLPLTDGAPLQVCCNGKPAAICLWRSRRADGGTCKPGEQVVPWIPAQHDFIVNAAGKKITRFFAPAPEHDFSLSLTLLRREWGNVDSAAPTRFIPAHMFGEDQHLLDEAGE